MRSAIPDFAPLHPGYELFRRLSSVYWLRSGMLL